MTTCTLPKRTDRTDTLGVASAEEFVALFELEGDHPAEGTPLPILGHWMYFHEHPLPSQLDTAGIPTQSEILPPPVPGARRLLGGGSVEFHHDLFLGVPAVRSSKVTDTKQVRGRSGAFVITVLEHSIYQRGRICLREQQDVIDHYEPHLPPAPRHGVAAGEGMALAVDVTTLFRFSAVMGASHRIHWDENYARTEGYTGLVVPGPFQVIAATHRIRALRKEPVRHVSFRYLSPLTVDQGAVFSYTDREAHVCDSAGRVTCRVEILS